MGSPFNSAWALLKTNPYPLTPQEETYYEMEKKAFEMAKNANPNVYGITDDAYETHIEILAQPILAEMIIKKKRELNPNYPWPKNEPFQSTFDLDGSINRDPKVSEERKLNARMARESNRREAVPSQIEIDPDPKSNFIRNFSLLDDEGNMISRIRGAGGGINNNPHIYDFYGETKEPYRRQGMYRKLMQALIGAGIPIKSDERNSQSNPFHQNFLENLPPNIMSSYVDEYGNPRTLEPYLEGMQHATSVEDLHRDTPLEYYQNKVPQFLDARGQRSGLNRQDYGAIPIVNQANQARNMDKLVEQDRAKIRRGEGHKPEMLPLHFTQPMARNTKQQIFDGDFENESLPLYEGYYNNEGFYERQPNNPQ
jgi:hypothetical protein